MCDTGGVFKARPLALFSITQVIVKVKRIIHKVLALIFLFSVGQNLNQFIHLKIVDFHLNFWFEIKNVNIKFFKKNIIS